MSANDVKRRLKDAREAITDKDMPAAIKQCREILKLDKDNYMAHLLIARAYQDINQGEAATYLRRAVELTTDPLIPYQGLLKCVKVDELPAIYHELLKLQPEKFEEYYERIAESGKKLTDPDPVLAVFQAILEDLTDSAEDEVKRKYIFINLTEVLYKHKEVDLKWNKLYAQSLQRSISRSNVDQHENYRRCIKLLADVKAHDEVLAVCCNMHESFKNDPYPLEWICKIYIENMKTKSIADIKAVMRKDIREYIEILYKLNPKSILGLITKGMHHYDNGQYFEALDIFAAVNEIKPNWATCLKMLIRAYEQFRAHELAEQYFRMMNSTDLEFAKCLVRLGVKVKAEEAVKMCTELLKTAVAEDKSKIKYILAKAMILCEDHKTVDTVLHELAASNPELCLLSRIFQFKLAGNYEAAADLYDKVQPLADSDELVDKGEVLYLCNKSDEAITCFLNALKRDLSNSNAFYWLARVYSETDDLKRAVKCLEKCLRMNPLNENALILFKAVYKQANEKQLFRTLLETAVNHGLALDILWPVKMIGFEYKEDNDVEEAAIYFRKALRISAHDYDCWIALGEIQMASNIYGPAQKIFEKICQLFPDKSSYSRLQIAILKTKANHVEEAQRDFEALLDSEPNSILILKEYAKAHLWESDFKRDQRLFGRSKNHLQQAATLLCRALEISRDDGELNCLMAKCLNFAATLPPSLMALELSAFVTNNEQGAGALIVTEENLLILANRFIEIAVNLTDEKDKMYHLLAKNSFERFQKYGSSGDNVEVLESAVLAIKKAISINPNRSEYWNFYGVLLSCDEIGEPGVAEEIFNKALEIDKQSFTVWANLGVLYLKCNEVRAANHAFGQAQQRDMGYVNGWLGQALIADRMMDKDEAMDLYRHCLELDYHKMATEGYTKWVVHRMDEMTVRKYKYAIEEMHAIPLCLDACAWYDRDVDTGASAQSLLYLGYLAYHKRLYSVAVNAYLKASAKAEGEQLDVIWYNLGYIYLIMEKPEQAIKAFKNIQKIFMDGQIGLAVAHFKARNYEVAYSIYEAALELAETDAERVNVLTAMAAIIYEFQGKDDAKTILMQCVSLGNPIEGLLNMCALSLLENDMLTAGLVVKELRKYDNDEKHIDNVAFLVLEYFIKKMEFRMAYCYILSMIHQYPNKVRLRQYFVNLTLRDRQRPFSVLKQARRVAESCISLKMAEKPMSSLDLANTYAVVSLLSREHDIVLQKLSAQRAIFNHPVSELARTALSVYTGGLKSINLSSLVYF